MSTEVARLLLPMAVGDVAALDEALRAAYGEDITVRGAGSWLVVERPDGRRAAADATQDYRQEDRP